MPMLDPFGVRTALETASGPVRIYSLEALEQSGVAAVSRLPFSIKVLVESALRNLDAFAITEEHVRILAGWRGNAQSDQEIPFMPGRVILQDFSGVPSVVDLAALRSALARLNVEPSSINPRVPADLVIDHSVQVDAFGSMTALLINADREFERNRERYEFLHWGQRAFSNFRVVPPASGIVHQVNLEYLAKVVQEREMDGMRIAFPDSLVGTDSHTTMINGLGVLGWGVGGIEAEAVMLGQPIFMLMPGVVGFKLTGELREGATATDLVLTVTQKLRAHGVVGRFVEFYGEGLSRLGLADRATIANMAPEYGATTGFFPVDAESLEYLRRTGRSPRLVDLVERYCKAQGLFRTDETPDPDFSESLELDMNTVEPSLAGPKRPQDRIPLRDTKRAFWQALGQTYRKEVERDPLIDQEYVAWLGDGQEAPEAATQSQTRRRDLYRPHRVEVDVGGIETYLSHGSVVIASITSCTNTSNPSVMIGAGLLARKAVELGLDTKPWVKSSLAPGSRVVTRYLEASGLMPYLQALHFHVVGYGCTTCIGNSGPLLAPIADAVQDNDLVVAAVLSGNRNFEGRINALVKANFLASPPLVVAYALAGTMDIDFNTEPLGSDPSGRPIYLADIWPTQEEIREAVAASVKPEMFATEYAHIFEGNEQWSAIEARGGVLYEWSTDSTYIQEPPFFKELTTELPPFTPIRGARVLALLGDAIPTDHISPAGSIPVKSPAGQYLISKGVEPRDFNSYGSRRGNHEVMMRGTFANIRLRNELAPGTEGGFTTYLPTGEVTTIYDASMRYQQEGTALIVLAGKEYGTGSSRDWAAKGAYLLGVKAVIAESYERIHRANLVGMGVLPLQFVRGQGWRTLGLTGHESYDVELPETLQPGQQIKVRVTAPDGTTNEIETIARVDS
ncbi:MAG TPA: aconitate hydratase AcnA, partial [Ardenticatenaceae bacterium]|nr:aconitate hydratase AcnA [Ardenticatenaceae bacterium]